MLVRRTARPSRAQDSGISAYLRLDALVFRIELMKERELTRVLLHTRSIRLLNANTRHRDVVEGSQEKICRRSLTVEDCYVRIE